RSPSAPPAPSGMSLTSAQSSSASLSQTEATFDFSTMNPNRAPPPRPASPPKCSPYNSQSSLATYKTAPHIAGEYSIQGLTSTSTLHQLWDAFRYLFLARRMILVHDIPVTRAITDLWSGQATVLTKQLCELSSTGTRNPKP
ncbi:hypothetical protein SARC_11991, partial [Sphaeroforma arctica JP610]